MASIKITGIEIGRAQVRVLQARVDGTSVTIERTDTVADLKQLRGYKGLKSQRCVLTLPRHAAFSRLLTLPTVEASDLRPMVELQARSLPMAGHDDIVVDYVTLEQTTTHTQVLVVGIPLATVQEYLQTLIQLGIRRPIVTLSTSGLAHWYHHQQPEASGTELLIDMDTDTVECLIMTNGLMHATRDMTFDGSAAWLDVLWRTLQSHRKEQPNAEPTRIVLTGDPAVVRSMKPQLESWSTMPVRIATPWTVAEAAKDVVLPQEGSWTALTGVMLPVDQPLLDLIPVAQQRSRSEQVAQRGRLVTMGLALGVLLMIAVGLQIDIQQHRTVQVRLEQQVQSAAPRVAQLKRALARMHQAQDVLAAQYSMASFLQDLYERTPSEITLRQWLHDTNRTIRIAGHTSALSMVLAYVSRLDDSPYLQDVQLRYSSKRETRQGMQVDFELVGQVTGQAR